MDAFRLARYLPRLARHTRRRVRVGASEPIGEIIRENVFTPYRHRLLLPVTAIAVVAFLPLALSHFAAGNTVLGSLLVALVAMLGADTIAVRRGRRPPIPYPVLLVPGFAAVAVSLATQGLYGALWAYPMATFGFFALPRRLANTAGLALLALGTGVLYAYQDSGTAVRFFLSLALCLVTTNVLLDVLESLHQRLLEHSVTDLPTGAYNRRHMETCLEHVIERHRRTGATASVLLLDMDRFRMLNDRFGVEAGDRVLRGVAELVRHRARRLDLLFRAGGEKFLVLLPDTAAGDAATLAEHLRAGVAAQPFIEDYLVTMSAGVSQLRGGESMAGWLARAEEALRRAKDEGRNRVMAS